MSRRVHVKNLHSGYPKEEVNTVEVIIPRQPDGEIPEFSVFPYPTHILIQVNAPGPAVIRDKEALPTGNLDGVDSGFLLDYTAEFFGMIENMLPKELQSKNWLPVYLMWNDSSVDILKAGGDWRKHEDYIPIEAVAVVPNTVHLPRSWLEATR